MLHLTKAINYQNPSVNTAASDLITKIKIHVSNNYSNNYFGTYFLNSYSFIFNSLFRDMYKKWRWQQKCRSCEYTLKCHYTQSLISYFISNSHMKSLNIILNSYDNTIKCDTYHWGPIVCDLTAPTNRGTCDHGTIPFPDSVHHRVYRHQEGSCFSLHYKKIITITLQQGCKQHVTATM